MKLYLADTYTDKMRSILEVNFEQLFYRKTAVVFDNSRYTIHSLNVYWMNCIMFINVN